MSYTEIVGDLMRSFNGIVKSGGCWKSVKQAKFLKKEYERISAHEVTVSCLVDDLVLQEGQIAMALTSVVRWADYGRRSVRSYGFLYVLDAYGVVKRFKLKYKCHDNGTQYPSSKDAVLDFERSEISKSIIEDIEKSAEEDKRKIEEVGKKQHIGVVGDRMETQLTLKYISESYGNYGITTIYKFVDADSNDIIWFSSRNIGLEKDKTYNMAFSVKAHQEYKGAPSTIITRAKIK